MRWNLFSMLLVAAGAGVGLVNVDAKESCGAQACSSQNCAADSGCANDPGACSTCGGGRRACCGMGSGGCNGCGGGPCSAWHAKHGYCLARPYPGLDRYFNCGSNGSYKFPVPPLYTYHWPGMFSQQLMTDYHSPWRFPPIKPYTDEQLLPYSGMPEPEEALPPAPPAMSQVKPQMRGQSTVQAADYSPSTKVVPGTAESISVKLKRVSQYTP